MNGNLWTERDEYSPDRPPRVISRDLLDLRLPGGREYIGVTAEDVLSWRGVHAWRRSVHTFAVGNPEIETQIFEHPLSPEERRQVIRKLDREQFELVASGMGFDEAKEDIRVALTGGPVSRDLSRAAANQASQSSFEQFRRGIMEVMARAPGAFPPELTEMVQLEHTGGDDCPACRAFERQFPERYEALKRDREEMDQMRVLIRTTPELLRWSRLIGGCVMIRSTADQYQARMVAMGLMTGDADDHPLVAGAMDALAILLRDDVDFARFRRECLEGRPSRVNEKLHSMEQQARAMCVVAMQGRDDSRD